MITRKKKIEILSGYISLKNHKHLNQEPSENTLKQLVGKQFRWVVVKNNKVKSKITLKIL